jgi:hypothetical protein
MLAEEAERVQAESRAPETLEKIRAVFGEDEEAYRRLVLGPILVNQLLHARFSLGHDIQAEPLARAKEALAEALENPETLPELAEGFGAEYRQLEVVEGRLRQAEAEGGEAAEEDLPAELSQYGVELPDYDKAFVEQVLQGLGVGEVHPLVVEDRNSFMVVRLLSMEGEDARLEALVFAKLAFEPWFQTQSQRISLEVYDRDLKEALVREVAVPFIVERLKE